MRRHCSCVQGHRVRLTRTGCAGSDAQHLPKALAVPAGESGDSVPQERQAEEGKEYVLEMM